MTVCFPEEDQEIQVTRSKIWWDELELSFVSSKYLDI